MTTAKPAVAIIGAGPGGLVLARLLHLSSVPFTLYEAEPHRHSREQGGSLDLHEESGQLALKEAKLLDDFQKIARAEGEDMLVADKTGHIHYEEVDAERHNRPEVDRIQLRGILLDSLPENAVSWGSKVRSIIPTKDGRHEVHMETLPGPKTEIFDLVVGADGAWSKVRPLLSDTKPQYSTISCLDSRIRDINTKFPHVSKMVGQGNYLAFSDHKGLIGQRNGDGSVRIYTMLQVAETWLKDVGIDWTNTEKAKDFLLQEYADWDDSLKDLIRYSDPDIIPRPFYQLPTDFSWASKPGLTMLGDAAHLMTPFAGEGVNLAMLDGLDLSKAVIQGSESGNLTEAIKEYERAMMERSHERMEETWRNLQLFFQKDAPREFVRAFEEMMAAHGPPPGGPEMPNPQA
ncbi:hypothetical protein P7C71_g3262, partial [Lecanoromycetidae sp. Uapishka_2]